VDASCFAISGILMQVDEEGRGVRFTEVSSVCVRQKDQIAHGQQVIVVPEKMRPHIEPRRPVDGHDPGVRLRYCPYSWVQKQFCGRFKSQSGWTNPRAS
jgi:hypothetical protein